MIVRILAVPILLWALGFGLFMMSLGKPIPATERTDAIVVLTGAPGRIDRGLALMREHAAKRMLVSGVDTSVKPRELAAQYREPRLFECCVDLGWEAVNTRSNADETASWVAENGYRTVRLVTSDWHMPRARLELSARLGDDVTLIGDPVPSSPRFGTLVREYHKYLVRWIVLTLGGS
ncbi:YdcF family protein [Sphingomonas sp. HF-S3]|uniref:YdcF family protein n=1 Tax=Sphingomonas rustica TaxID=3103142 RepID=A0ABV0BAR3_9SPHN